MTGLSLWQAQKTGAGTNEHDEWLHRLQHWHLSPISYVDCLAFCLFLAAGLLKQIGLVRTVWTVLWTLPFLLVRLPLSYLWARFGGSSKHQAPFFIDIVLRCVRYAFANIDYRVGRVFFSKDVAAKFYRYRLASRGWFSSPTAFEEREDDEFKGIWIRREGNKDPDVVVYYIHGGGFVMGSPWFYLEFLQTFLAQLVQAGYENPAIFALDYTLVPDASFPTQLRQALRGYEEVLRYAKDASKVVLSGDSAGATLCLSLLLHLARQFHDIRTLAPRRELPTPGMAVLISPWVTLHSPRHRSTPSDYLDAATLGKYAAMYAGKRQRREAAEPDPLLSPGTCTDAAWWKDACPARGMMVTYGDVEVFTPEIDAWIRQLEIWGIDVDVEQEWNAVHAWPVASVFLCSSDEARVSGLRSISRWLHGRPPPKVEDGREPKGHDGQI